MPILSCVCNVHGVRDFLRGHRKLLHLILLYSGQRIKKVAFRYDRTVTLAFGTTTHRGYTGATLHTRRCRVAASQTERVEMQWADGTGDLQHGGLSASTIGNSPCHNAFTCFHACCPHVKKEEVYDGIGSAWACECVCKHIGLTCAYCFYFLLCTGLNIPRS